MHSKSRENHVLAAPLVLFLLALLGFPALLDLYYSFSQVGFENLRNPKLNGLENYRAVFSDPDYLRAAAFSMKFGLITAFLETVLGLFLAIFLAPLINKRPWLMAILMMPMMIAPSLMGLMYRMVLHEFAGPLPHYLYSWFGSSPAFLGQKWVFTTVVTIETLQWTPFTILLFYTAYSAIPQEICEVASVDGAKGWRRLWKIELPQLYPTLVIAFGIRFIDGFRVFDNVYVLTGQGPGGSTTSMSIYIYTAFFKSGDIGKAVAASVILFVVAFTALWLVSRAISRREKA